MTRDSLLETIDRFWKVRMAGDKAELRSFMAPAATYEMVGAQAFAEPGLVGPAPAGPAADRLIDAFAFHRVDRLTAIVDGSRAADVIRVEVSFGGGTPVKNGSVRPVGVRRRRQGEVARRIDIALVNQSGPDLRRSERSVANGQ